MSNLSYQKVFGTIKGDEKTAQLDRQKDMYLTTYMNIYLDKT